MKKATIWACFFLTLYVLQSSLLPLIAWREISADLLLVAVVSVSFFYGSHWGVCFGFCAGLFQDLATGTFFGIDIFSKMIIGYTCGAFSRNVFKEQMLLPVFSVIVASVVNYFVILLFMLLLGYRFDWMRQISGLLLPTAMYNAVFAFPIYFCIQRLSDALKEKR